MISLGHQGDLGELLWTRDYTAMKWRARATRSLLPEDSLLLEWSTSLIGQGD